MLRLDANSIVFTEPQAVEDCVRTIEIENIRLKEIDKRLDELQAAHHETELPLAPREDIERWRLFIYDIINFLI